MRTWPSSRAKCGLHQASSGRADGITTRRTGTSVALLGAEGRTDLPDGERRPTTLEDAFVVLTGEEIE